MLTYAQPFRLSDTGSDRATAYNFCNKAVTLDGRTHVVWTDSIAVTRACNYDHAADRWGEPVRLGLGADNHNSPTLTADRDGRLHLAYGPHGMYKPYEDDFPRGKFKYAVADEPGSLRGLEKTLAPFGYAGTYPCLLNTPGGEDVIVYRGGEPPCPLLFQKRLLHGGWTTAQSLMRQEMDPQYTHVNAMVACDAQGTLYVAGHFFAGNRNDSLGIAVLRSDDGGQTWTDMRGRSTSVPICFDERFSVPAGDLTHDARLDGIVVDDRGTPWVLTSTFGAHDRTMLLSRWDGTCWQPTRVETFVPDDLTPVMGGLSVDVRGRLHIVCTVFPTAAIATNKPDRYMGDDDTWWGHRTLEAAHLVSSDGGRTFSYHQVSPPDDSVAHWLPAISKPGPFHPVEHPVILFTRGMSGHRTKPSDPCRNDVLTEVYAVLTTET